MTDVTSNDHGARRSRVVRNAIVLGLTALGIYGLYIFLIYRAGPGAG